MPRTTAPKIEIVYHLECWLRDIKPIIHRRLAVPKHMSLAVFHHVLQIAFGWENSHLHEFDTKLGRFGDRTMDVDAGPEMQDEKKATVEEVLTEIGDGFLYTYDFGDDWHHGVVLHGLSMAEPGGVYPCCLGGARSGPPEDCGGPYGYQDLVKALGDPKHKDREEYLQNYGPLDAEAFSADAVNRALAKAFGFKKPATKKTTAKKDAQRTTRKPA